MLDEFVILREDFERLVNQALVNAHVEDYVWARHLRAFAATAKVALWGMSWKNVNDEMLRCPILACQDAAFADGAASVGGFAGHYDHLSGRITGIPGGVFRIIDA